MLFSRPNTGINFDKYDNIQVDIEGHGVPAAITSFTEAKLHDLLMANIALARYDKPTPVQKYSIPILSMANRDLMASAQTGTVYTLLSLLFLSALASLRAEPSRQGGDYASFSLFWDKLLCF